MKLSIQWVNATRGGKEKEAIEQCYGDRLMDLFGTADAAYKAHEDWHKAHNPPIHHWTTYGRIAEIDATKNLLPSERKTAAFVVKFEHE